uniref:Uncharacterized protein n=1 Tax=Branchiostoma floridae TaxID=7739 RepID=C3ZAZ2_BRAFL|eukprot:XP_002594018.1 hypothetical protein BRAFLDRAFT_68542 [Branchiostoma floridae]
MEGARARHEFRVGQRRGRTRGWRCRPPRLGKTLSKALPPDKGRRCATKHISGNYDLKRVTTRLRSTLTNANLKHLLRISIEGPAVNSFDFDKMNMCLRVTDIHPEGPRGPKLRVIAIYPESLHAFTGDPRFHRDELKKSTSAHTRAIVFLHEKSDKPTWSSSKGKDKKGTSTQKSAIIIPVAEAPNLAQEIGQKANYAGFERDTWPLRTDTEHRQHTQLLTVLSFSQNLLFDTVSMMRRVPQFRLDEVSPLVAQWLHKRKATKRDLQSLIGKLVFVSACVPPGRLFVSRMHETLFQLLLPDLV